MYFSCLPIVQIWVCTLTEVGNADCNLCLLGVRHVFEASLWVATGSMLVLIITCVSVFVLGAFHDPEGAKNRVPIFNLSVFFFFV